MSDSSWCSTLYSNEYYFGTSSKMLQDYTKIFKPIPVLNFAKKFIDVANPNIFKKLYFTYSKPKFISAYSQCNVDTFILYTMRTLGNLYIKMLSCIEDMPCSYQDIYDRLLKPKGKPFGNDVESFKNLEIKGLTEIDHIGKYKKKFFKLTPLGRLVLETAKKNNVAYKVLRHFMKFKDDFDSYLVEVNFNPETMDDITPISFVEMLDAILNDNSVLHEIGSYAYWCHKLLDSLKKSELFFEMFNCPEVNSYLDNNVNNQNVQKFKKMLVKISEKYNRK